MGTSRTVNQFARKIEGGGTQAVTEAVRKGVMDSALAGKGIFLANMGTRRLRNVGKGGAKVGARYDAGATSPSTAAARLYYTGPAHLINNDTKAHSVYPRGAQVRDGDTGKVTKRRRKGGAQGLRFPDGGIRVHANHPGTTGKKFFERSVPQVEASRRRIMRAALAKAMRSAF